MKINLHNNIDLELVDDSNLELLRQLRNHPSIQQVLAHKGIVSEEHQKKWFDEVDKRKNVYFLVLLSNEIKGYALLKNIDADSVSGEPGIFLIDSEYYGSTTGGILTISFLDICNVFFGIKYFFGNVLKNNSRALFNYNYFETEKEEDNQIKILHSKTEFSKMQKINTLREFLQKTEQYSKKFYISHLNEAAIPHFHLSDSIIVL